MMRIKYTFLLPVLILVCASSPSFGQEKENLKVFTDWLEWTDGENMLMHHLNRQAFQYLDMRDSAIAALHSKSDWKARQEMARKAMLAAIGEFPEKTPLNARVTGTVKGDGFHVEKILFESMPGNYVTSCLFVPDGIKGKRPAVLFASGHSGPSYRVPIYQHIILNLVKKGFIVFAFDPIGQGERRQYFGSTAAKPVREWPTEEHTYAGLQCLLTGETLSKYFIWDGIRALDYLVSRPEVDPKRIGMTGRSGGGTQTGYVSAFDDRILAAAPDNYFTSHRRLLESRGPQDAEQDFYHWLSDKTAIEDLLVLRMPRPTLLLTTTRDIFSIQGARELYPEISRGYSAFGATEDFQVSEDNAAHSSTKKNREVMYRFFQKYLSLPGNPEDEEVQNFKADELNVTPTGQIVGSFDGETVFSLNAAHANAVYKKLDASRNKEKAHLEDVLRQSKKLSGYHAPDKHVKSVFRGNWQRDGYTVGMYGLQGEGDYVVPLLLAIPDGGTKHAPLLYIHPDGKETDMAPGGTIEQLVKQGYAVAAPDLSGIGEIKPALRFPAEAAIAAMLVGRSIVGIQAGEIARIVNFLKEFPGIKADHVQAVAFAEECPSLLHAAAYEPAITNVMLVKAPLSYYTITQTHVYTTDPAFNWGVAGALTAYDLPDLAACIAPRKLTFAGLQDGEKKDAPADQVNGQMKFAKSIYAKSPGKLTIASLPEGEMAESIAAWLEK
jgi:dienelactone hydrolase